jgi:hypothetical protein
MKVWNEWPLCEDQLHPKRAFLFQQKTLQGRYGDTCWEWYEEKKRDKAHHCQEIFLFLISGGWRITELGPHETWKFTDSDTLKWRSLSLWLPPTVQGYTSQCKGEFGNRTLCTRVWLGQRKSKRESKELGLGLKGIDFIARFVTAERKAIWDLLRKFLNNIFS